MSGNIAVIYAGDIDSLAEAFGAAAGHLAARVRLLRLGEPQAVGTEGPPDHPSLHDLDWADAVAFGTPIGDGDPDPALMRFIESTEALWSSGSLSDTAVTVFTDEPEHIAPDSVLHPIYDALYRWGAVIVGPRGFELELDARVGPELGDSRSPLPGPRLRSIRYRAFRLARLAGVLADDRTRWARLEL